MDKNKKSLIKKLINLTKEEEEKIIDITEEDDYIKISFKNGGNRLITNSIISSYYDDLNKISSKKNNEKINIFVKSDFMEVDKKMKKNIFNVDIRKFISMCKTIDIDTVIHTTYDNLSLIRSMNYDDCVSIKVIESLEEIEKLNVFIFGENELDELISIKHQNIYMITPNKLYDDFYWSELFSQSSINLLLKLNKNKVNLLIDDELKSFNEILVKYNKIQKINYKVITNYEEIQEYNNRGIVLLYDKNTGHDLGKLLELISPTAVHVTVIDRSNQREEIIKLLEDNYISSNHVITYENDDSSKKVHIFILKYILRLQKVFIDATKLAYIDKINELINGHNVSIIYDNEIDLDEKYIRINSLSEDIISEIVKIIETYSDVYDDDFASTEYSLLNDSKENIIAFSNLINKIK